MASKQDSFDTRVAKNVADRLVNESKAVAELRDVPPGLRFSTPEEELQLFNYWDERVDPVAVFAERFIHYASEVGLPPDGALAEAILDTCAAGFPNRLKMAGLGGRLSLTEQTKYLEDMAMKSRSKRESAEGEEGVP